MRARCKETDCETARLSAGGGRTEPSLSHAEVKLLRHIQKADNHIYKANRITTLPKAKMSRFHFQVRKKILLYHLSNLRKSKMLSFSYVLSRNANSSHLPSEIRWINTDSKIILKGTEKQETQQDSKGRRAIQLTRVCFTGSTS